MATQSTHQSSARAALLAKHDSDVVIVAAVRSAITKVGCLLVVSTPLISLPLNQSKKGGFKDTRPEEILSAVLRAAYLKAGIDPALIDDISVGNVLPPGGGATAACMAALHAGIPIATSTNTVNRRKPDCERNLGRTD